MAESTSKLTHTLVDFDDGHRPGGTNVPTKMAIKAFNFSMPPSKDNNVISPHITPNQLQVFDSLLPPLWCDRAYSFAVNRQKPWGIYIKTKDLAIDLDDQEFDGLAQKIWDCGDCEKALSLIATRHLLVTRANLRNTALLDLIDGTAVWCLTSSEKNSVEYHIDYAELYRYETNTIFPPLLAGTCQVSPVHGEEDMVGGDFRVNLRGLDHYKEWGYKARLVTPPAFHSSEDSRSVSDQGQGEGREQLGKQRIESKYGASSEYNNMLSDEGTYTPENGWINVTYTHNRGILHEGVYPHLSTRISHLKEDIHRVILGFNCFSEELSECNVRAPEHSDTFNRTIKLYQKMAAMGIPITVGNTPTPPSVDISKGESTVISNVDSSSDDASGGKKETKKKGGGINVKDVMKNPALAKLIVNAAKIVKKEKQAKEKEQEEKKQVEKSANGI